jgi:Universal stress protein UspA and related nucleotide-binding proteins
LAVLYVIDLMEGDYQVNDEEQPVKRSERIESETRQRAEELDVDPAQVTFITREGRPANEIIAQAATDGIEQVIMGSRGLSGVKRLLLGSVAETVVRRAEVPVNVIR